jgi:polyphosphate glucokinase
MTAIASSTAAPSLAAPANILGPVTLSIDIGGSGLKAMLLDAQGKPVSERQRVLTPTVPTPQAVMGGLGELARLLPGFDRVSAGFPGVVKHGITYDAFNLHPSWALFPFQAELEKLWRRPARVGNDADIAGYGAIKGVGVELVLTFGTGLGASIFTNGHLVPGLELGHQIWRKKGMSYEDYLGRRGLDKFGKKTWNKLLRAAIESTQALFNWDYLYLGGGNTKKIDIELPPNVSIVPNENGILGGVYLWRDQA